MQSICQQKLNKQRQVTSNLLLKNYEDAKFDLEQIYVPLALVERRKPDKREGEHSAETGTKLYEPQYEEKQRFEHEAFLQQILEKGESKAQGKRIALIGEPGAGKTTTLQAIAFWVLEKELGLPIWISLADLERNGNLIDLKTYLFDVWLSPEVLDSQKDNAQQELKAQIEQGRVWLLLDGVDEVAASGVQILKHLSQQLTGWLAQARIMLTCRLNTWEADLNFLSDFETYRLLDFDYPQEVDKFINNWFSNKDISSGEKLKIELNKPENARLRDLIQNPLRLMLLCHTWQRNDAKLANTKAELYAEFVSQIYKCNRFPINDKQKQELHQALGRLAIKDIDESNSRFRLRESFIKEELGNPNEKDSLFDLALRFCWLNQVGIAAESFKEERVYAFLHPTFEEYFAALAINREYGYWNFFLPCKHQNKPGSESNIEYRIFKLQWQEVILFWLGREDIDKSSEEYLDKKLKEDFINALIQFKDGCGQWSSQIINRGFYEYQAYFLAAKGVAEYNHSQTKIIVEQIIDYVLFDCLICSEANATLMATNRKVASEILKKRLQEAEHDCDKDTICEIAEVLGRIDPGNWLALNVLPNLLLNSSNEETRRQAINVFCKIATNNAKTIKILLEDIIPKSSDKYICQQAVRILGKIGKNNELVINALVKIFGNSFDKFNLDVCDLAKVILHHAEKPDYLWSSTLINFIKNPDDDKNIWDLYCTHTLIDDFNEPKLEKQPKITDLIEIIENNNPRESGYLQAIVDLGKVSKGDERAIAALTKLCQDSSNEFIKLTAVETLYQIAPQNKLIIETLLKLVKEASHRDIIIGSIDFLGKINEIDNEIVYTLAKVVQNNGDEIIICRAAEALCKIDPGNEIAIDKLIDLIKTYRCEYEKISKSVDLSETSQDYEYNILLPAEVLGKIAPEKEILHDTLIKLIQKSSDALLREGALNTLIKINNESLTKRVIINFKKYLLPSKYENSLKIWQDIESKGILSRLTNSSLDAKYDKCRKYCRNFEQYYAVVWLCSKSISYEKFYQAWHQKNFIFYLKQIWKNI